MFGTRFGRLSGSRAVVAAVLGAAFAVVGVALAPALASSKAARTASASEPLPAALAVPRPAAPSAAAPLSVNGSLSAPVSGRHYLYAEDATNPDGIDVFSLSGTTVTFLQHVTVGSSPSMDNGGHNIAWTQYPGGTCLAFATAGNATVYSFTIASNGTLSTSPVSAVGVGGYPNDLAAIGNILFESNPGGPSLDVLTFSTGCHLSLTHQTAEPGTAEDFDIALINANQVVSADANDNNVDNLVVYSLGAGGVLTESATQAGAISSPFSVAVWNIVTPTGIVTNVYTGQSTAGPPQAQGFRLGAGPFDALKSSPATDTDSSSKDGAAVALDTAHKLLVQANNLSGQIAWYTLTPGSTSAVGSITYGGDTPLAINDFPQSLAVYGSNLFVAQGESGDVEDCALATTGVSACHSIITLTGNPQNNGSSVAIK